MSSGSACWILWLTPMDWLALSIGRSGSQPLEYSPYSDVLIVIIDSNSHETFPTTPAKSIRLSVSQIILILNTVLEIGVAKNEIVPTFAPIAISASVVVISELN